MTETFFFREPACLALGLLVVAGWVWWKWRRPPPGFGHSPLVQVPRMTRSLRQRSRFLLGGCRGLVLGFALVALAGPTRVEHRTRRESAREVVLVIDQSSSMAQYQDEFGGRRLDACRESLAAFVRGREGDRLSVLGFARTPRWICPPTFDGQAVLELLAEVEATAVGGPEDRTGIGAALALAARSLQDSELSTRVVLLVTDGENNVDEVPVAAAWQWCREVGLRLHVLSVGSARAQRGLEALCRESGGQAFEVGDQQGLTKSLAAIDQRERQLSRPIEEREEKDLARWFLAFASGGWLLSFVAERTLWRHWA